MGLDDLIPENANPKSSSGSSKNRSSSSSSRSDEDLVSFGEEPHRKTFTKERWENIRRVISRDFGLNVNQVLNNYSPQKRHKVLHEAALEEASSSDEPRSELWKEERCPICDSALHDDCVELGNVTVCRHHPAWIIAEELDMEEICD